MKRPVSAFLALVTAASPVSAQVSRARAVQPMTGVPVQAVSAIPTMAPPRLPGASLSLGLPSLGALPGAPSSPAAPATALRALDPGRALPRPEGSASQAVPALEVLQQGAAAAAEAGETSFTEAKTLGASTFDTAAPPAVEAASLAEAVVVPGVAPAVPLSWRGRARTAQAPASEASPAREPFGGPRPDGGSLRESLRRLASHAGQGLRWGLNMIGLLAAVNVLQFLALAVYQQVTGATIDVNVIGGTDPTVEAQFGQALARHPWGFLFYTMTWQMIREEAEWRFFAFGGIFLALASFRPLLHWLGGLIAGAPAGPGASRQARARAWLGDQVRRSDFLARWAFPLAALAAGLGFAAIHLPGWNPEFFAWLQAFWTDPTARTLAAIKVPVAVVATAGIVLRTAFAYAMARLFYKTRSLVAPVVAHWLFDAVQFFAAIAVLNLGLAPVHSAAYFISILLIGAAVGWYNLRRALQDRKAARSGQAVR